MRGWGLLGKKHREFDVLIFEQSNSTVSEKVEEIRTKCAMFLCSIDREEKKRYAFN